MSGASYVAPRPDFWQWAAHQLRVLRVRIGTPDEIFGAYRQHELVG